MVEKRGPFPSPLFEKQMADNILSLTDSVSGEVSASLHTRPIGSPKQAGKIVSVWLSAGLSGKAETSNALQVETDILINDVSCLTTKPVIGNASGEAAVKKTTQSTGDTEITQAVVNTSANEFSAGDVITANHVVTRTSPDSEIINLITVVEVEPN